MTGVSGAGSVAGGPLPKWQLALAVVAPVALGFGYMYYKNSTKPTHGKPKVKENGTAAEKQISIDSDGVSQNTTETPEPETPLMKAMRYKENGNNLFKIGKYLEAIAQFNNAIAIFPDNEKASLAKCYQNRAAAYEQLKKWIAVKEDCTHALELDPKYKKALLRRARAFEHCSDLQSALEDVIVVSGLEGFTNRSTVAWTDRLLSELGRQHAIEHLATKEFIMPSKHLIKTYMNTFYNDPVLSRLKDEDYSNITPGYRKALQALSEQRYDDVIPLCTEELARLEAEAQPCNMEVLLLRATFYTFLGQQDKSLEDFNVIIASDNASDSVKVNALIKRTSLYKDQEDPTKISEEFAKAVEIDPDCGDIYHHRGQVNLLMKKIDECKADFEKSVKLNPDFGVGYVQKCYADYRCGIVNGDMALMAEAESNFEEAFKKFPDCSECYSFYAQLLSEMQQYVKSDEYFVKAIEKDPTHAGLYVQRAVLHLQWKGDFAKACAYIHEALELDEKCQFGYEVLGTIEVQRGNMAKALELFNKAISLASSLEDLANIFSLKDTAQTHLKITKRFGLNVK